MSNTSKQHTSTHKQEILLAILQQTTTLGPFKFVHILNFYIFRQIQRMSINYDRNLLLLSPTIPILIQI